MKYKVIPFVLFVFANLLSCSDKELDLDVTPPPVEPEDSLIVNTIITSNSKWTIGDIPIDLSRGTLQGAAYYNGTIYQFRYDNTSSVILINYDLYDVEHMTWKEGKSTLTCIPNAHVGSACFAPKVLESYTFNGKKYNCKIPFVFFTGHYEVKIFEKPIKYEIIDVVDIENDNLIRRYTFPNRLDDVIAAYDFDNNRLWIIGYGKESYGMSPYVIDEYEIDLLSMHPEKINFTSKDVKSSVIVGGPNKFGFQENLDCGTLQDAEYYNGYIYIAVGLGSDYQRTETTRIHSYDVNANKIVNTVICPDFTEAEGFARVGKDLYMTTIGRKIWKLSNQEGYDNKYNFEPAKEVAKDSYEISNASQLVWFKSQVYNGRSYIKGVLTADIDMSEVVDPFTFYVYDINIEDGCGIRGRKYESFYAFRGSFDGQGHTISNFSISKTPYYNDGFFPYVVDATIKNLKITGDITLTKADHVETSAYDIMNVGFIGYMNGGSLENIDVSGISFTKNNVKAGTNVHKLVGSENGDIKKSGIIE